MDGTESLSVWEDMKKRQFIPDGMASTDQEGIPPKSRGLNEFGGITYGSMSDEEAVTTCCELPSSTTSSWCFHTLQGILGGVGSQIQHKLSFTLGKLSLQSHISGVSRARTNQNYVVYHFIGFPSILSSNYVSWPPIRPDPLSSFR